MAGNGKSIARGLANLLFPPQCMSCRMAVAQPGLCATCWSSISFLDGPGCACCGLPFAVAMEGEKLTSSLFDRYAASAFGAMEAQARVMDRFSIVSPAVAVRRVSTAAAETDLRSYRSFLEQAEAYRFALVQRLNRLQATAVTYDDDGAKSDDAAAEARSRISADNWRQMPPFAPRRPDAAAVTQAAAPALAVLALWFLAALALLSLAAKRLARSAM